MGEKSKRKEKIENFRTFSFGGRTFLEAFRARSNRTSEMRKVRMAHGNLFEKKFCSVI
jgi:hypothetical protein